MNQKNWLLYITLIGIISGGICGWVFGQSMENVAWMGDLFLDALKMLVVPLIISSMIVGIAGLGDIRKVGKTGALTFIYFMLTTAISVAVGLLLVNLLQPGTGIESTGMTTPERVAGKESAGLVDIVRSFISNRTVVRQGPGRQLRRFDLR